MPSENGTAVCGAVHSRSTHKTEIANDSPRVERIETTNLIPIEQFNTTLVDQIDSARLIPIELLKASETKREAVQTQPVTRGERYATVGDYFKAGNPNATTYRLGEPWIQRKSFSAKQRAIIHQENGGCCQVCGSTQELEVEHWRGLHCATTVTFRKRQWTSHCDGSGISF